VPPETLGKLAESCELALDRPRAGSASPDEAGTLAAGAQHYRAYVGPPARYDLIGALSFSLLTLLGLREQHVLLDLGCGSLRAGRLFLPYLLPDRYFGIEPNAWLIQEGLRQEIGHGIRRLKRPRFAHNDDFDLGVFGVDFDFILAQSILSHTSRKQLAECLASASRHLRPGGLLVATIMEGTCDDADEGWRYPGCSRFRWETVQADCAAAGLHCRKLDWPHPSQLWFAASPDPARLDAIAGAGVDFIVDGTVMTDEKLRRLRAGRPIGFLRRLREEDKA
jgi:SAM-dependent methyltransferase